MHILYGVCGDGLGHAMRARTVAAHLVARGHRLAIAASGRAAALVRQHGLEVIDVRGLHAAYARGGVERGKTVAAFLRHAPANLRHNARAFFERVVPFRPDLVITDFEAFAWAAGRAFGVPIVSLDHQHVVNRFRHPWQLVAPFAADFAIARAAVGIKTPECDHYVVTSFYFPEPCRSARRSTTLVEPLVRPEVEQLVPRRGDHVLVYQTTGGDSGLIPALRALTSVPFRVYGMPLTRRIGNVDLCAFDERTFLQDLASARAVIANGGFTALAEAVVLGKPVLSVPLVRQAEQQLNAAWLEALGLGMCVRRITPHAVQRFLDGCSDFDASRDRSDSLRAPRQGAEGALAVIDRVLAEVA
jgi:uncharacterized protein (TIGR00661 family)